MRRKGLFDWIRFHSSLFNGCQILHFLLGGVFSKTQGLQAGIPSPLSSFFLSPSTGMPASPYCRMTLLSTLGGTQRPGISSIISKSANNSEKFLSDLPFQSLLESFQLLCYQCIAQLKVQKVDMLDLGSPCA